MDFPVAHGRANLLPSICRRSLPLNSRFSMLALRPRWSRSWTNYQFRRRSVLRWKNWQSNQTGPLRRSPPNMTVVVFTAGLEQRRLTARPELPTITSERSLSPTRARLAVAPDGVVRHVMLERSCGSTPVDEQALEIARHLRFEPAGGTSALTLTWGVAKFVWATAPPTENHN